MTRFNLIRTKNSMLFANILANVIGICVVLFLVQRTGTPPSPEIVQLANRTNTIFSGTTRTGINGDFPLKELPATRVKGKSRPIEIFTLV